MPTRLSVAALFALGLGAAPASAHATLETTTPANGAELPAGQPPKAVSLKFSESVQIPDNAIRVVGVGTALSSFKPGQKVDVKATLPDGSPKTVSVTLGERP